MPISKFHQFVEFAAGVLRGVTFVYTNIAPAYQAEPHPHISFHMSVTPIPTYIPLNRRDKPALKLTKTKLQD